jgi:hypothetical protein
MTMPPVAIRSSAPSMSPPLEAAAAVRAPTVRAAQSTMLMPRVETPLLVAGLMVQVAVEQEQP